MGRNGVGAAWIWTDSDSRRILGLEEGEIYGAVALYWIMFGVTWLTTIGVLSIPQ